ncbi:hypothetical protein ACFOOP_19140 [Marinicaulis aureus]|uniref:Periplasmic heavy metal sensor n=1 Tax=Hyphococcus aureus TaxID=2666033 RepID=A0ABW1KZZ4_9PROT
MNWLIPLSATQTVLLAALGLKVVAIDMRTDDIAEAVKAQPSQLQTQADPAALSWDNARSASLSGEEMRNILREEIAALETLARATSAPAQPVKPQHTPKQIKTAATAVDREINYFRSRGAIDEVEMASLQAKIAKLPLAERRAALSSLTKAMSKGEIDGWM